MGKTACNLIANDQNMWRWLGLPRLGLPSFTSSRWQKNFFLKIWITRSGSLWGVISFKEGYEYRVDKWWVVGGAWCWWSCWCWVVLLVLMVVSAVIAFRTMQLVGAFKPLDSATWGCDSILQWFYDHLNVKHCSPRSGKGQSTFSWKKPERFHSHG